MIGAFFIGLFGSVHCLGMCGPLMVTFTRSPGRQPVTAFLLYHFGRLLMYSLIGVLFGVLSMSLYFFEFQKIGAISVGVLIVLVYGFPKLRNRVEGWYYHSRFYQKVKNGLTSLYSSRVRWLAAGVLNGLLPCGLIYLAAAGAVLAGGMGASVRFMVLFGLGTLPMLLVLSVLSHQSPKLSRRFSNLTTPIALISGMLLIMRGVMVEHPDLSHLIQSHVAKFMTVCGF